jgi:glycosyltransferase involved in cell wall biosynthesis
MPIISIGIMAHNEEKQIAAMIADLSAQTIFERLGSQFEIHVVANGCHDNTAETALIALNKYFGNCPSVKRFVDILAQPGKANAWNQFIHNFSNLETEYVVLLDADIGLPRRNTIEIALDCLAADPIAHVTVDQPVKDAYLKPKKSILDRIVLRFSGTANDYKDAIAGSFYCARYKIIKEIWMPSGIIGEDGYLRAMIMTSNFTQIENKHRVKFAEGALHSFETRLNLMDIFHHQVRLAIGTGLNILLFFDLRDEVSRGNHVSAYIKKRNEDDSGWLNLLVAKELEAGKYFVLDFAFLLRRPRKFMRLSLKSKLLKFPVYLLGTIIDFIVYFRANSLMRKGASVGFW